jgi:transcriptional regulator with PAS, ATPase and Fis domain
MHSDLDDRSEMDAIQEPSVVLEESLSLAETEKHLIKKALSKYNGRRKMAADELGISERTLYRKIKEYDLG